MHWLAALAMFGLMGVVFFGLYYVAIVFCAILFLAPFGFLGRGMIALGWVLMPLASIPIAMTLIYDDFYLVPTYAWAIAYVGWAVGLALMIDADNKGQI